MGSEPAAGWKHAAGSNQCQPDERSTMAPSRICSIPDCGKPHVARGWCGAHYNRWHRHGDVLGGRTPPGKPARYFDNVVVKYAGDDCLVWPFARGDHGYGLIVREKRNISVSRLVCEVIHGPPNAPNLEAAHACGRGHLGCVAPRHLSWKTPKENQNDRIEHDTHARGERNTSAKLTREQVRQIRSLCGTHFQREIGTMFGVSLTTVNQIHHRKTWTWLD